MDLPGDLPSARPFAPVTAAMRPGPAPPSTYSFRRPVVPSTLPSSDVTARLVSAPASSPTSPLSRSIGPLRFSDSSRATPVTSWPGRRANEPSGLPAGPAHGLTRAARGLAGGLTDLAHGGFGILQGFGPIVQVVAQRVDPAGHRRGGGALGRVEQFPANGVDDLGYLGAERAGDVGLAEVLCSLPQRGRTQFGRASSCRSEGQ